METTLPPHPKKSPGRIVTAVARYVLGLPLLVFGLNAFFNFIPQPKDPIAPAAAAFAGALFASGYMMPLLGVTFLLVGGMLVTNRFVPPGPGALRALHGSTASCFHACLEHSGLPMSIVFLALELYLAWSYRSAYRSMLAARVVPG